MKRATTFLLLTIAAFAVVLVSEAEAACTGASPNWTSTPDRASVADCVSRATAGDTIRILAGSASWSGLGAVTVNKRLAIVGATAGCPSACNDATTIQPGSSLVFNVTASDVRISGITFEGATSTYSIEIYPASDVRNWRIDHCHFKNPTSGGRGISVGRAATTAGVPAVFPGLVDHNRFSAANRYQAMLVYGGSMTPHGSWDDPLRLGGASFVFIEDNHFVHSSMPDGVSSIDSDTGARYVIRYNTFINGDISAHGIETGDPTGSGATMWRSTHGWEIYGNTFTYSANHTFVLNFRGGTGVVHSNTVEGAVGAFPPVRYVYERGDYARSCGDAAACQGSNPFDGNESGKFGYPCYHQIGVTGSNGITKMPAYQWGSTYYGRTGEYEHSHVTFDAVCNYQHVQQGRDYIAASSGPLASRPATCSVDQAYWATDEGDWNAINPGPDGRLYRCTSRDTWTLSYTPFAYPHSGEGGGGAAAPMAPINVRVR